MQQHASIPQQYSPGEAGVAFQMGVLTTLISLVCRAEAYVTVSPREMHLPDRLETTLPPPRWALIGSRLNGATSLGTDRLGAKLEEEEGEKVAKASQALAGWLALTCKHCMRETLDVWVLPSSLPPPGPKAASLSVHKVKRQARLAPIEAPPKNGMLFNLATESYTSCWKINFLVQCL